MLGLLIYLDDILERSHRLKLGLAAYRRALQNMRTDPAKYFLPALALVLTLALALTPALALVLTLAFALAPTLPLTLAPTPPVPPRYSSSARDLSLLEARVAAVENELMHGTIFRTCIRQVGDRACVGGRAPLSISLSPLPLPLSPSLSLSLFLFHFLHVHCFCGYCYPQFHHPLESHSHHK